MHLQVVTFALDAETHVTPSMRMSLRTRICDADHASDDGIRERHPRHRYVRTGEIQLLAIF